MNSTHSARLIIHSKGGVETIALSGRTLWTFGRSKENTVQIQDLMASRIHAQLEVHQNVHYYFVDLNSRNGTLINDEPITSSQLLNNGDRISIGDTVLVFEQQLENDGEKPSSDPAQQVLMLYASAAQVAFWQEILAFRGIAVLKEETAQALKGQIDLNQASDTQPKVLLIDVRAYQGDCYQFCRWLRQKYPQYQVFLMDSKRREVSLLERQVAIKNGAMNQFPATTRRDLVLNSTEVLKQVNEILGALNSKAIEKEELLFLLRTNENLKEWHSAENLEMQTILKKN
ncbi:FHA domain-containing protein [Altericista sp. CCNU0014]|uniref:FHA domain-containing protein n=1 Tax=Altericista sp. CCNU0014 TaxID=3082949 RepID=UPI003850DC70